MELTVEQKRIALFKELHSLTDDLSASFFKRNCNMPLIQIRQLIKFAKKGHSLDLISQVYEVPKTYIRLLDRLDDITPYPCLTNKGYLDLKILDELEMVLTNGLDDFMYRTYAHLINGSLRMSIYELLISGKNVTRDVDYPNIDTVLAENYVQAIKKGYNKSLAGNLLFAVLFYYQEEVLIAHKQGVDLKKLFKIDIITENKARPVNRALLISEMDEYDKVISRNNKIAKRIVDMITDGINVKQHEGMLYNNLYYPYEHYVRFIKYSKYNFVPDYTSKNSPYMQYLNYIGAVEKTDALCEHEAECLSNANVFTRVGLNDSAKLELIKRCVLKEIEYVMDRDLTPYYSLTNAINYQAIRCILLGEDVSSYLALNLGENLLKILIELIGRRRTKHLEDKIAGLSLLK